MKGGMISVNKTLGNFKLNLIYQENCLEGMKRIPNKSIDMILSDLPYGITARNKWDTIIPFDLLWKEYERIIKDRGAIVLTAAQPFTSQLVMSNQKLFKYEWIWKKNNGTGHLNARKMPMREHETILVFYKKHPTYNPQGLIPYNKITKRGATGSNYNEAKRENFQEFTNYPRTVLEFPYDTKKFHPTQKPVALFEYLIKTYTNEGEIVLDNCMGSGTTAVASENTNRYYIGFETEKKYIDIANNRLDNLKISNL
jgi:site-specific DNA-methyltransferase (adenine-specific)